MKKYYYKGRGFRTCPICGANLDPGEICDCEKNVAKRERLWYNGGSK